VSRGRNFAQRSPGSSQTWPVFRKISLEILENFKVSDWLLK